MEPADVDALVVMSFGGPEGPDEVMPFLRRVVAGRAVPDARLEQVAEQYRAFGGVSPLNENNRGLVRQLRKSAPQDWIGDRVYLANRNSEPSVSQTVTAMADAGITRAAVFITSAFSSYSGCRQYRENLADGVASAQRSVQLLVLPRFDDHPLLREIWVDRVAMARPDDRTRVLFVTHSLPVAMSGSSLPGVEGYLAQHERLAGAIAAGASERLGRGIEWRLVFQSRSGPPTQPWLEPDIADAVSESASDGCERVMVAPIGFCADNLEIRWDLDVTAAAAAADAGLGFERLALPQADPRFVDLVWDTFAEGDGHRCLADCCPNPRGRAAAAGERSR